MTRKDDSADEMDRRTVLRALGVTGVAATGVTAFAGSAAAQQSANNNPITYNPNQYDIREQGGGDVEEVGSLKVSLTDVSGGTADGTVVGKYQGENGVEQFEESFTDAPISVSEANSGSALGGSAASMQGRQTLIFLDLGPIFLNVLGLIIETSRIRVRVSCDPAGGLLGRLLCDLLA